MTSRAKLKLVHDEAPKGPALTFIALTRNPRLRPPVRFEPTVKQPGDIVISSVVAPDGWERIEL
jgi:hypothetical protein